MADSDTFTVVDPTGQPICDVARSNYVAMNGVLGVTSDAYDNNGASSAIDALRRHEGWSE